MTRNWKIIAAIAFLVVSFSVPTFLVSAGYVVLPSNTSEQVLQENYTKNYTKFKTDLDLYVTILEGETDSVRIEASEAFLKTIVIKKTSKTISIEKKEDTLVDLSQLRETSTPDVIVTMKNLEELEIGGKAKVQLSSFKGDNLSIDFSSESSLSGDILQSKRMSINHTGTGFISLIGVGQDLIVNSTNSGRSLLRNFIVKNAKISTEGSGGIEINVSAELSASLNGSSPVRYQGNPKINQTGKTGNLRSF
jgi:hypothetical protein